MASESGFSNQKKLGIAQFKTIHSVGGDKFGQSVASKALYEKAPEDTITVTEVIGISGQVEFLDVDFPGSDAAVNDVLRITQGPKINLELDIISVISVNNFLVLPIVDASFISGSSAVIMAWVTNKANIDGSQIVTLAPVPLQFVKDSTVVNVNEDTVTPANNVPLPVKEMGNLSSLVDNVALGDSSGNFIGSNISNNNSVRSLAVSDDDGNFSLDAINNKLIDPGFVDYDNAWSTPLAANGVFTGAAFEVTKYAAINVCVASDVASATGGVKVQFSVDGTIWDHSHSTTYAGGSGVGYIFNVEYRFARVVYTNGATPQTSFRLLTIFKVNPVASSLYTLSQAINSNMFAALNRSVIAGETTGGGGGYVNVKVNPSGALTVEADVTGTVSVSNFPATQPVSGSVSVSNFPVTQAVTGTFFQATQPVSGSVSVSNFPATQAVTGTFFQATQPVSGSVSISNFPATQNTLSQTDTGTITSIQKSVGTSAVRATVAGTAPSATRKRLLIKPSKNNTGSIYLGASSVTNGTGLEIIGPDRLEFLLDASDYYLISDTSAQVVEIIEVV